MALHFYVLYNTSESAFYIDNQFGYTNDVLMAERYPSKNQAQDNLKYFKNPKEWEVKVVLVQFDL